MKLAFCLYKYFPFGGLQRDFLRIAKACLRHGHQVKAFTLSWEGEREPGIEICIIPVHAFQNHIKAKQFADLIQPQLREHDLVIGFNKMPGLDLYFAADACYQIKARQKHGFWYRLSARYQQWVKNEQSIFSPDAKTEILLLSQTQQIEFMQCYHTQAQRFHLLNPGIAKDRIPPPNEHEIRQQMRQQLGLQENDILLLFVGSGFKTKGLDRVLKGYASLDAALQEKTHLYIIGKDHTPPFIKLAKKLKISHRIHFLGGRNDVLHFLLAADVLLHPAYYENAGNILLEAIVAGLPILTTDVCGYSPYILQSQAGIVLKSPFQQSEFNTTLKDMLLSSNKRFIYQQNARLYAKTSDLYQMVEQTVNLIEFFGEKKLAAIDT